MILGLLLSLYIGFASSKHLEPLLQNSNEEDPPASQTKGFIPGKVVFSTNQKIIILVTIIISAILIIIGLALACKLGKKTKKDLETAEIEKYMLPPSTSPFSTLDDVVV